MSCSLGDQLFFPCLVMKYHIYTMLKHQWPFPLKSLLKPVWFSELGRKWKFCCRGSREWRPGVLSPFASWQSLSWNLSCWLLWHRNGESSQGLPFQLQAITKWSVRPFVTELLLLLLSFSSKFLSLQLHQCDCCGRKLLFSLCLLNVVTY